MNKKGIKIIKQNTAEAEQIKVRIVSKKKKKTAQPTAKIVAREVANNVGNWVSEFQQKRREETANAFKQLFGENTQPSST